MSNWSSFNFMVKTEAFERKIPNKHLIYQSFLENKRKSLSNCLWSFKCCHARIGLHFSRDCQRLFGVEGGKAHDVRLGNRGDCHLRELDFTVLAGVDALPFACLYEGGQGFPVHGSRRHLLRDFGVVHAIHLAGAANGSGLEYLVCHCADDLRGIGLWLVLRGPLAMGCGAHLLGDGLDDRARDATHLGGAFANGFLAAFGRWGGVLTGNDFLPRATNPNGPRVLARVRAGGCGLDVFLDLHDDLTYMKTGASRP